MTEPFKNTPGEPRVSDLIDLVHHEHHHMTKLFGDLRATFTRLGSDELEPAERQDLLETAQEDLRAAFDELLHHFDQEEEVFFVEIERRFPELADDIAGLVRTHEYVCERTRWLQQLLTQGIGAIVAHLPRVGETLTTLQQALVSHTLVEDELFGAALRKMSAPEREALLRRMRELG